MSIRQVGEYDSEMSRATSIPVRLGDSDGIQSHPLISSAVAVGDATAILPVVSTLVFGFAFENLLVGAGRFHRVSEIFLGLSASLSLYTTAFSVLEFYYVKMLTSADIYRQFMDKTQQGRSPESRAFKPFEPEEGVKPDGETLAQRTDDLILRFTNMRNLARNALWWSIAFLLCAGCSEVFAKSEVGSVKDYRQHHLARWQVGACECRPFLKEKTPEVGLPKIELEYISKYDGGASAGEVI